MQLQALLNPAPEPEQPSLTTTQAPSLLCTQQDGARPPYPITNDKESFELALWRQESGLGPPSNRLLGGPRLAQYATLVNPPPAYADAPFYNNTKSSSAATAAAAAAAPVPRAMMPRQAAQPRIFVARPPIVGHSAMSMDRSDDYIRSANPDDGSIMEGALALPAMPTMPSLPAMPTMPSLPAMPGSSSPASSFASFMRSPSQYSAASVSPVLGKRARTACTNKGAIADDFEDDEDDDDDEPQTASPTASVASSLARSTVGNAETVGRKSRKLSSESSGPRDRSPVKANTLAPEKPLVDWEALQVPEAIWSEAQELYEQVKTMKKVQNRQPVRKRHAILAALMFILCRRHGYPRTFAEICTAGSVTKREIGMYYNLMKQVLGKEYTSSQRASPAEFVSRWCNMLELPVWLATAATKAYDRADKMGIVQGKCPISVSAACIWLLIWGYNHRHSLSVHDFALPEDTPVSSSALPNVPGLKVSEGALLKDQKDVCKAAGVVIATLTSVFKQLLPKLSTLVDGLLVEHL